jgi:hypothetical protein
MKLIIAAVAFICNLFLISCQSCDDNYEEISWKSWKDTKHNIVYYSVWNEENCRQNILIQKHNSELNAFLHKDSLLLSGDNYILATFDYGNSQNNSLVKYCYKEVGYNKRHPESTLQYYVYLTDSDDFVERCKSAKSITIEKEIDGETYHVYNFKIVTPLVF